MNSESNEQEKIKFYFSITLCVILALMAFLCFCLYLYYGFTEGFWIEMLKKHFATLVVLPFGAVFSLAIVVLLRITNGPFEFELLGLKLKGASGPVLFWVIAFMTFISAVKLLW